MLISYNGHLDPPSNVAHNSAVKNKVNISADFSINNVMSYIIALLKNIIIFLVNLK